MSALICRKEQRRERVRQHGQLNGIDYLEVSTDPLMLTVYFLGKAPVELDTMNVRIDGGRRIRDIRVKEIRLHEFDQIEFDDYMEVDIDKLGDFSTYTLRVIEKNEAGQWLPHSGFDPRYDRIEFNFKVDCPSDLDCKQVAICPPEPEEKPDINYLAKDYASFRQLILDRLALVMPEWKERHVPDIGIALVEVLAYVGDHLSYYQDAVATEAYLDTARKRISVRRHARLVDYPMHEGCNARAWICIEINSDLTLPAGDAFFITRLNDTAPNSGSVLSMNDFRQIPASAYEVFEPIAQQEIQLYRNHSKIHFYTWGDNECCLPRGTTTATLIGKWITETPQSEDPCDVPDKAVDEETVVDSSTALLVSAEPPSPELHFRPGDVLIFEEVIGPETGFPGDADPDHRHAVRLTKIEAGVDPLNGQSVIEITWAEEDALPFPLCLSALGPPPDCKILDNISIACGNVVLVDHGQTVDEDLDTVPEGHTVECCKRPSVPADTAVISGRYSPSLKYAPLTFSEAFMDNVPASQVLMQDVRQALPQIILTVDDASVTGNMEWTPQRDLLGSDADDRHFVAETDNDGSAQLRFGNGESGRQPQTGAAFQARYRIGVGLAGNVGSGTISHLVSDKGEGVTRVRNPLAARGGTAPEPVTEVKLFAPHTFRKKLQRAIIADDYAAIVQREFKDKVQRAAARLRWTGSGYEMLVAIDPYGEEEANAELLNAITGCLHRYRRIGHDLVVKSARRVPLDIEIGVCVLPGYLRGHVKAELLGLLSHRLLATGQRGFFHVDNLTFGDDIYLSQIVAAVQAVSGVESVRLIKLQRLNELPNQELEKGVLLLGPFEIARLDNDPSFPENGKLTLDIRGGR